MTPADASGPQPGEGYPRTVRLQRYLARSGVASRRASENLMTAGRVTVNGKVVTELGSKVDPERDEVAVDGKVVVWDGDAVVVALNKPAGYVSTMSDPGGKPCIAELVPTQRYPGLYPIGRLDRATSGLLLFATDGRLGHGLLHPSHHVNKLYEARVQGRILDSQVRRLSEGVEIDGRMTAPAHVQVLSAAGDASVLHITIHEGRYRQVRRMCDAVGHTVLDLKRLSFGPVELADLPEGAWRMLDADEVARLYEACGLAC